MVAIQLQQGAWGLQPRPIVRIDPCSCICALTGLAKTSRRRSDPPCSSTKAAQRPFSPASMAPKKKSEPLSGQRSISAFFAAKPKPSQVCRAGGRPACSPSGCCAAAQALGQTDRTHEAGPPPFRLLAGCRRPLPCQAAQAGSGGRRGGSQGLSHGHCCSTQHGCHASCSRSTASCGAGACSSTGSPCLSQCQRQAQGGTCHRCQDAGGCRRCCQWGRGGGACHPCVLAG